MVSIITVNYNGWRDTCELIASLKQHETYPYEIIVVDNASQGDDVLQIERVYPDVTLVRSERNLGFAGGNNLGYTYAKGEYIFFFNNDMVIKSPILEPMVLCLTDKAFGGVSPCIQYLYHPGILQYYGYLDLSSITLRHTTEAFDPSRKGDFLKPKETEVLHGGAMMVSREVIEQVGRMTEIYFLFFEEFDWSRCIRKAGYRLYYEPASVVYHKEGMTIRPQTPLREYYLTRGRVLFARRNLDSICKIISCCYLLGVVLLRNVVKYLLSGDWGMLKATVSGSISGLFINKKR